MDSDVSGRDGGRGRPEGSCGGFQGFPLRLHLRLQSPDVEEAGREDGDHDKGGQNATEAPEDGEHQSHPLIVTASPMMQTAITATAEAMPAR